MTFEEFAPEYPPIEARASHHINKTYAPDSTVHATFDEATHDKEAD